MHESRRRSSRALERVLEQVGAAAARRPRRSRSRWPRCRSCGSSRCPRAPQDLDQLVRWQVRKTAPFPIEEAQVSYVPGARSAARRARNSSSRWRGATSSKSTRRVCADAGAHAGHRGSRDVQRRSTPCSPRAPAAPHGRLAAGQRRAGLRVDRDPARPRPDFLPQPRRDTEGTLADLVHQTAMYYEDRLSGAGFGRASCWRGGGRRRSTTADVEQIRRSLEERLADAVETVDPRARGDADRPHFGGAGAARYARAARRPAASRTGGGVIRTNLVDAAVLQRARRFVSCCSRLPCSCRRRHGVQRHASGAVFAQRHAAGDAGVARRARAADLRSIGRDGCARASTRSRSRSRRPKRVRRTN